MICILCGQMGAQTIITKEIDRSFVMSSSGELQIVNKYGDIQLKGTDGDSIRIHLEIIVEDNSDDLMGRVEPRFDFSKDFLRVNSIVSPKRTSTFNKFVRKLNPIDDKAKSVQVDYVVEVPKAILVSIDNRFGDIRIEDFEGRLTVKQSHGDVRILQSPSYADLDVDYGYLKMPAMPRAKVRLNHSTMKSERIERLNLESQNSRIEIASLGKCDINSSRDHLRIDSVDEIDGSLRFSEVYIGSVQKVDFVLTQSDLQIEGISDTREGGITLDEKNSDILMKIFDESIKIRAVMEDGLFRIPERGLMPEVELVDNDKSIRDIRLDIDPASNYMVTITGKKGTITIE